MVWTLPVLGALQSRRILSALGMVSAVFVLLVSPVSGQEVPRTGASEENAPSGSDTPFDVANLPIRTAGTSTDLNLVSLDVVDTPLADVVEFIRERSGTNIVLGPSIDEIITLKLTNVPWKKALELAAEKAGCILRADGVNLLKVEKPPRVTFYFEDTDVKKVIDAIGKVSGANIITAPQVVGAVNMRINDVPWREALDSIVKTLGYAVVEDSQGILRVVPPAMLEEQMESRVFELKYVRPPASFQATIETDYAIEKKSGGAESAGAAAESFSLLSAISKTLSTKGRLDYISERNVLIVTDTVPHLNAIGEMIQEIDVEPAQIFVDVKFVISRNTDFFDLGVDIGDQGWQAAIGLGSIPTRLPFNLGKGGFEDSLIASGIDDGTGSNTGTLSGSQIGPFGFDREALASQVQYGTLDFTGVTAVLRILKRDVSSEILQSPKLLALDNHPATIFVGETIRFAQVQAEQGQAGGLRVGIEEADNSPVQTGFQLMIVPHIIPGTRKIMMTVIPEEESLSGTSAEMPGFDVFTSGAGTSQATIALPRVASRTVVTNIMLESGKTAVFGGLLFDTETETINKVPILGDIPILGYLFKNETKSRVRNNLIIFITPTIIEDSGGTLDLLSEDLRSGRKNLKESFPRLFMSGRQELKMEEEEKRRREEENGN